MQAFYPAVFEREAGCTDAEWLGWLPGALGDVAANLSTGRADVRFADGSLQLTWEPLPPRQIALVRLPRLRVRFCFEGLSDERRYTFMRRFDLYMQRGGG